jgi:hypothetical protein
MGYLTALSTTVLSTTRFPEAGCGDESSASNRMLISSKNFAEFFAELRAEKAPNRPLGSSLLH